MAGNPSPTQEVERRWLITEPQPRALLVATGPRPPRDQQSGKRQVQVLSVAEHKAALLAEVEKREEVEGWNRENAGEARKAWERVEAAESKLSSAVEALKDERALMYERAARAAAKGCPNLANYLRGKRAAYGLALQLLRDKGADSVTTSKGGDDDVHSDTRRAAQSGHVARPGLEEESGPETSIPRWKLWVIDRGESGEDWRGAEGPPTNPPDDCGLTGMDWVRAATVEVVEASRYEALDKIADDLAASLEAEEELLQGLRDKAAPCSRCGGDGRELVEGGEAPCGDCEGTGVQVVIASDQPPALQVEEGDGVAVEGDAGPLPSELLSALRWMACGRTALEYHRANDGRLHHAEMRFRRLREAGLIEATRDGADPCVPHVLTPFGQQQLEQSTTGKEDCER